jgi:hypothetical protein
MRDSKMDKTLEVLLYQAALRAAKEMGDDLKNMSCFVSKWADITADEDQELEAA